MKGRAMARANSKLPKKLVCSPAFLGTLVILALLAVILSPIIQLRRLLSPRAWAEQVRRKG